LINNEINKLIEQLAKSMGTSKRNVISLALSNALTINITKEKMDEIKENIHLDRPTTVTTNEEFYNNLSRIPRFGLSKRVFFGYLICDYFYSHNEEYFVVNNREGEEMDYVIVYLDKEQKENILNIAESQSMTTNAIFIHYILNKDIDMKFLNQINKSSTIRINVSKSIKEKLDKKAKLNNVSRQFYLSQVVLKIEEDFNK